MRIPAFDTTPDVRLPPAPPYAQAAVTLWSRFLPGDWIPVKDLLSLIGRYGVDVVEATVVELGESGSLSLPALQLAAERAGAELTRRERNRRADKRVAAGGGS